MVGSSPLNVNLCTHSQWHVTTCSSSIIGVLPCPWLSGLIDPP
jgi:hypothetical protein